MIQHLITKEQKQELKTLSKTDFKFFDPDIIDFRSYLVYKIENKIVGMICYNESSFANPNAIGIGYVTVNPQYKNMGIASEMIYSITKIAQNMGKKLRPGTYTNDGDMYIQHVFERTAYEFNVELV